MFSSKNIISLTNENAIIIMFMNMIKDYSGKLVKGRIIILSTDFYQTIKGLKIIFFLSVIYYN